MPGEKFLLVGLANDELGYIIPKRQWDDEAPFAYGRSSKQYGEVNSIGSETAPIIMQRWKTVLTKSASRPAASGPGALPRQVGCWRRPYWRLKSYTSSCVA